MVELYFLIKGLLLGPAYTSLILIPCLLWKQGVGFLGTAFVLGDKSSDVTGKVTSLMLPVARLGSLVTVI